MNRLEDYLRKFGNKRTEVRAPNVFCLSMQFKCKQRAYGARTSVRLLPNLKNFEFYEVGSNSLA